MNIGLTAPVVSSRWHGWVDVWILLTSRISLGLIRLLLISATAVHLLSIWVLSSRYASWSTTDLQFLNFTKLLRRIVGTRRLSRLLDLLVLLVLEISMCVGMMLLIATRHNWFSILVNHASFVTWGSCWILIHICHASTSCISHVVLLDWPHWSTPLHHIESPIRLA